MALDPGKKALLGSRGGLNSVMHMEYLHVYIYILYETGGREVNSKVSWRTVHGWWRGGHPMVRSVDTLSTLLQLSFGCPFFRVLSFGELLLLRKLPIYHVP